MGLELEKIGQVIGICWDWDCVMLGLGLRYARIGIGIC
jgi:hypothetical protein